jgi:hypothetical protein
MEHGRPWEGHDLHGSSVTSTGDRNLSPVGVTQHAGEHARDGRVLVLGHEALEAERAAESTYPPGWRAIAAAYGDAVRLLWSGAFRVLAGVDEGKDGHVCSSVRTSPDLGSHL